MAKDRREQIPVPGKTGMLSLIVAVCGALSCEQSVTIKGTITVPVAVQQQFSSADRGRVVIWLGCGDRLTHRRRDHPYPLRPRLRRTTAAL